MEALNARVVKSIIEKLAWYLRRENILISSCEVRERSSKIEVMLKLENNVAGLSVAKIVFYKGGLKRPRVYTGRTSFDLRIKRFIIRELEKVTRRGESTT